MGVLSKCRYDHCQTTSLAPDELPPKRHVRAPLGARIDTSNQVEAQHQWCLSDLVCNPFDFSVLCILFRSNEILVELCRHDAGYKCCVRQGQGRTSRFRINAIILQSIEVFGCASWTMFPGWSMVATKPVELITASTVAV